MSEQDKQNEAREAVQRWSSFTKRSVALMFLIVLGLALYRFRSVIPPLLIAFLLAFILNSIVGFLTSRLHISHGSATNIVFLTLIVLILGAVVAPVTAIPSVQEIVYFVENDLSDIITEIDAFLDEPIAIWNYSLDLSTISDELVGALQSFVSSVAEGTLDIVRNVASGIFWLIIILTVAFYLVKDAARFTEQFDNLSPPGYRKDTVRIRQQITDVWNAFLRGQLVMGLAMSALTTVVCLIIGLPYALIMGLIAGVTEFIPNVGPIIALIPAVLVALFKGSLIFVEMGHFWFAVLVIGAYIVIQQIEGNILVPRILGESLNLHPLLVLISIIIGGNMAGIVGMLLAAPILATLRVVSNYIFCRLYDRDPFAEPEEKPPSKPSLIGWAYRVLRRRLQEQGKTVKPRIRPARAKDLPAVEVICAQIWEGDDYIPRMWDDWLADPHGQLVTAELKKRVVGLGKLSRLADDEWWMEGLRVDPTYRQQKVGGLLHAHLVKQAQQIGRGTLRFGTHSLNEPVHRMAAGDDFRHIATYQRYRADPLPVEAPSLRQLTEQDLPAAWALVGESSRYRASGGLYEVRWVWKNLSRERLARHLAAGEVWGTGEQGKLSALALVYQLEDTLSVGLVDGKDDALAAVLRGLRELAAQFGRAELRIKPLDEAALMAAIELAGYERDQDKNMWIFELGLEKATE